MHLGIDEYFKGQVFWVSCPEHGFVNVQCSSLNPVLQFMIPWRIYEVLTYF